MSYCFRCESYYHSTEDCPFSSKTIQHFKQKQREEETLKELKKIRELLERKMESKGGIYE